MIERIFYAACAVYMLIAVVTFGDAYHQFAGSADENSRSTAFMPAFYAAAVWPLYVSVRLWEPTP